MLSPRPVSSSSSSTAATKCVSIRQHQLNSSIREPALIQLQILTLGKARITKLKWSRLQVFYERKKHFTAQSRSIPHLFLTQTHLFNLPSWNVFRGDTVINLTVLKMGFLAMSCQAMGFSTLMLNLLHCYPVSQLRHAHASSDATDAEVSLSVSPFPRDILWHNPRFKFIYIPTFFNLIGIFSNFRTTFWTCTNQDSATNYGSSGWALFSSAWAFTRPHGSNFVNDQTMISEKSSTDIFIFCISNCTINVNILYNIIYNIMYNIYNIIYNT